VNRVSLVVVLATVAALLPPVSPCSAQHKLLRVRVETTREFERLSSLGLDVASSLRGSHVDIVVNDVDERRIALLGFETQVLVPDIEAAFAALCDGLGEYHSYSECVEELLEAESGFPDIARVDSIGRSYENRPILAIKISDEPWVDDPLEADVLFVALHHAREVATPDVVLYLMHYLLDNYGLDARVTRLVDTREIWIVPVLNPDGHVFVEQGNFLWRKNRRPAAVGGCVGVDINRNYGFLWGLDDVGSSGDPCSQTYRGQAPFSEFETRAIRDLVLDEAHDFTSAISYHSYGRLILFPWGYTPEPTPDHDIFEALADSMAAYNGYRPGAGNTAIYPTNGDFGDWMYGDKVVTEGFDPKHPLNEKPRMFAFTFEVGGSFKPEESMIPQLVSENLAPNLFMIEYADEPARVLPPAAPQMDPPVVLADGGTQLVWRVGSSVGPNVPVSFDVDEGFGVSTGADGFESEQLFWQGSGFQVTDALSLSGSKSLHTGSQSLLDALFEPVYPIEPAAGETLTFKCRYSFPPGHYFFVELAADGGDFTPALGEIVKANGERAEFTGVIGGESDGWDEVRVPLDSCAGRYVNYRFRCTTSQSVPGEGIYIDDVRPVAVFRDRRVIDGVTSGILQLEPSFEDILVRVRAVDAEGQRSSWSPPVIVPAAQGPVTRLSVLPNVLGSEARISFVAYGGGRGSEMVPVKLEVFDAAGRRVRTVFEGSVRADALHEETWFGRSDDGSLLPGGVYFVVLTARGERLAQKVMLVGRS